MNKINKFLMIGFNLKNYMLTNFITCVTVPLIELKLVQKSDVDFLYEILSERTPNENISHREMPTYKKHAKFVLSKPYKKWYVIYYKKQKFGSIYLTNLNEIGIHFKKNRIPDSLIIKCLELLISKNREKLFLINISPKNKKLLKIIKKNKFKLIQYTYELQISG